MDSLSICTWTVLFIKKLYFAMWRGYAVKICCHYSAYWVPMCWLDLQAVCWWYWHCYEESIGKIVCGEDARQERTPRCYVKKCMKEYPSVEPMNLFSDLQSSYCDGWRLHCSNQRSSQLKLFEGYAMIRSRAANRSYLKVRPAEVIRRIHHVLSSIKSQEKTYWLGCCCVHAELSL